MQQELGLDVEDFRLWIALHETTHAFEFEAYPWLRAHFNELIEEYFKLISGRPDSCCAAAWVACAALVGRARENLAPGDSWIEAVMTAGPARLFDRLQALMAVVEGYSNYIMNSVGARLLPSYEHIKEQFEARAARRSPAEKLFVRLTGLALKMEQYRLGETFIDAIVAARGPLDSQQALGRPRMSAATLDELTNPQAWLLRVGA